MEHGHWTGRAPSVAHRIGAYSEARAVTGPLLSREACAGSPTAQYQMPSEPPGDAGFGGEQDGTRVGEAVRRTHRRPLLGARGSPCGSDPPRSRSAVSLSFTNHRLELTSVLFFLFSFFLHSFPCCFLPFHQPHCGLVRPNKRVCLCTSRPRASVSRLRGGLSPFMPRWVSDHACPARPGFQIGGVASGVDLVHLPPGSAGSGLRGLASLYPRLGAPFTRAKAGPSPRSSPVCFPYPPG